MSRKPSPRRVRIVILGITLGSAAVQFLGCDQTPPVDVNFDSSVGADFRAPPQDAGTDTGAVASDEVSAP
jgi:hypothetical protein